MYTLTQSINWAQTFEQYVPFTAGLGQEPAVSSASFVRYTLTSAPITWAWNRGTYTLASPTVANTQDYTVLLSAIPDFGFLEKVALQDGAGKYWEIDDVYNNLPLSISSGQTQRPDQICLLTQTAANLTLRFLGVPNAAYTVTLIYQKKPQMFGPFLISSAGNASGGNTAYAGAFDPLSFPTGSTAQITGFVTNAVNNGSFTVVTCTSTTLTVANSLGVAETIVAYASNFDWAPIPDSYGDVYNYLFLSEMALMSDDTRAPMWRQRGIMAFLAKSEGLTEMQKKAFIQQWLAREVEHNSTLMRAQMGNQAKGI